MAAIQIHIVVVTTLVGIKEVKPLAVAFYWTLKTKCTLSLLLMALYKVSLSMGIIF
jgi:hypothetical protein